MGLPTGFRELANQRFEEAKKFWRNWRTEARDDFDFVAGKQWLQEDEDILREQKRPPITFNYSEKMIDAVVGAEVSSRQEIHYSPREMSDAPLAELWTNAAKWVRDEGDHEDEETDAFRDCLICGMGWTYTNVNYEEEMDGMIDTGRIDPLDMYSDPSATKPNIKDRRYNIHMWWTDERVAKKRWPKAIDFATDEPNFGSDVIRTGHRYEDADNDVHDVDLHAGQVQIRHYECVEMEPIYRVATEKAVIEVAGEDFTQELQDSLDEGGITYVKQQRRVYYYGFFAGETLVESGKSPCQTGFCYQAMTGKRDRNKSTWYGLTRVMKDPQRWANKWLSQILHIINSNAKGGLMAEVNAFVDPKRAEEEWSKPDSIVFLKEGALSGKRIQEKQMASYPQGLDRLMEFALSSLPQVTGINLEALGLAGRDQANVLEQSRKQAAYGLLAPIFDSLRRYRKLQGRVLLDFIHNYISDGRLIRIGGRDSEQFVPLTKADKAPRYDILVDQSPNAPDVKQKTWTTLETIVPAMMKAGIPVPPDLLDFAPIPVALSMKWKQYIEQNPPVDQNAVKKMQDEAAKLQEENQKLQMQLKNKSDEFALKVQETNAELTMKDREIKADISLALMKLQGEMKIAAAKANADVYMAKQKQDANIEIQRQDMEASNKNEADNNVMKAVNNLIGIIGKLNAEDAAEKATNG